MYRESKYDNDTMEEDTELMDGRMEGLGRKLSVEKGEVDNAEVIESARKAFDSLKDRLSDEYSSIIDSILKTVEAKYNPEDPNDAWVKKAAKLYHDVLIPFDTGDADEAASALVDLEAEIDRM